MNKPKKLLFVHDRLPAEGISGMVIFLRHFKRLQNWEIHILIPENSLNKEVIDQYPKNFIVHTFKFRQRWWPPFRESNALLIRLRLFLMAHSFKKVMNDVKPDVVISVLYHYYSVAVSQLCAKINLPFILFLHDRWDNKIQDKSAQQSRLQHVAEAIKKSSYVLSVTERLVHHYVKDSISNYEVFPPIPEGYEGNFKKQLDKTIIYAGTVNQYHIELFNQILNVLALKNYTLLVLTNDVEKLHSLATNHKNLSIKKALPSNTEAMEFIADNAAAILVNYGMSEADNPDAFYSFPSKFVEFVHLKIPIIASAPQGSPFHTFLIEHKWPFVIDEPIETSIINQLERLDDSLILNQCYGIQTQLSKGIFDPNAIQDRLEAVMNQITSKANS